MNSENEDDDDSKVNLVTQWELEDGVYYRNCWIGEFSPAARVRKEGEKWGWQVENASSRTWGECDTLDEALEVCDDILPDYGYKIPPFWAPKHLIKKYMESEGMT